MPIYANIFKDYTEDELLLSTDHIKGFSFSTQLPGGFAEGGFTLPSLYFPRENWYDLVLGRHLVMTDEAGSRIYEGSIEGVEDNEDGIGVQGVGYYAKAGLKTVYLVYPTPPIAINPVIGELCDLIPSWRSELADGVGDLSSQVALEFLHETKVQEALEKILKEHTETGGLLWQFAVYEYLKPYLFYGLSPWYKVSTQDLSLKYGASASLSGTFNRIQVMYDLNGNKNFTDWYEDLKSQQRYGIREGTLNAGAVPAGVAQVAGELAIERYARPDQQENVTIHGQIRSYTTDMPVPAYWLRAGHLLFVTDLPANPQSRYAFMWDKDQAGLFIQRTTYNHDDGSLSVEVGDGFKSLEQYLVEMEVSGGDIR